MGASAEARISRIEYLLPVCYCGYGRSFLSISIHYKSYIVTGDISWEASLTFFILSIVSLRSSGSLFSPTIGKTRGLIR